MTPDEFYKKFHVSDAAKVAAGYRNPKTSELKAYAEVQGAKLVADCGIPGAEYFIGGSLGYDAVLKGGFDIDLRLLVPDEGKSVDKVHREIDSVQKVLINQAESKGEFIKCKFIDEGGTNYIQHTKQLVRQPWAEGEIELTWNIQSKSSYKSVAGFSAKLPQAVCDRYVAAKGLAKQEPKEIYDALKVHWRDFIDYLLSKGARDMDGAKLENLLQETGNAFPLFVK